MDPNRGKAVSYTPRFVHVAFLFLSHIVQGPTAPRAVDGYQLSTVDYEEAYAKLGESNCNGICQPEAIKVSLCDE